MASNAQRIANFNNATRLHTYKMATMTRPTGGGLSTQTLPRTGYLQGILLDISVTVAGSLSNPNALGVASILNRIRLTASSSYDIFNVSGAGYTYLVNEQIGSEYFVGQGTTLNQGGTAVTATTFKLNVYIPVALNRRDPTGLFMLQTEQQTVELQVTWEADATVATGATVTGTCVPYMQYLTIPSDPDAQPPLLYVHQILEDSVTISGAGDYTYSPLRGNVYVSVFHGLTLAQSAADSFNRLRVLVGGSDTWMDLTTTAMDALYYLNRGRTRRAGTAAVDYAASAELGMLGISRDYFDTLNTTDYQHIITATGSGTLTTVRRMLTRY